MITVIVAMYNGEKYICECIDSIINQDYQDLEIILVDDGSPDRCGSIAKEYASNDARVHVIQQSNSGVSSARNNALQKSHGEYICIIDQDDVISSNYVSYLYELCRVYDSEIALTPSVDKFFTDVHEDKEPDKICVISGEDAAEMMLFHKIVISPWNKIFKAKLIKDNNIVFNRRFFNGEGFLFSIECYLRANRVAIGNKKIYHYRVGDPETGASKFKKEYIMSSIGAQEYIKNCLPNNSERLMKAWEFSNWHTHCDCLNVMLGCEAEKYYPELYKTLKSKAQEDGLVALKAPVSIQQKLRGIMFRLNPYMASKMINRFRVRKFTKYIPGGG